VRRFTMLALFALLAASAVAAVPDLDTAPPAKPPVHHVPPTPDPEVMRQGGDTIQDAVVISLPHESTGTIVGYHDDYEESCPFWSVSPDVVYQLTPPADMRLDIDLLGSTYDTKVFVYDEDMNLVACNDDYYPDYVSRLVALEVQGGVTYNVIIDGYAGDSGEYVLSITEWFPYEAECQGGVLVYEENEPPLVENYQDAHNGGCNSPEFGSPFQALPLVAGSHECFHGRSGWFTFDWDEHRDTDWFTIEVWPGMPYLELGLDADWPCYFLVLGPQDCDDVDVVESWLFGGSEYGAVEIQYPTEPGTHWVWVGPTTFSPPAGAEDNEFDYYLSTWGDLPVEQHSWSAVKGLFD
jgi:hypothetical protein